MDAFLLLICFRVFDSKAFFGILSWIKGTVCAKHRNGVSILALSGIATRCQLSQRESFIRADRKIPKSSPFGGAGCDHREQTERVVAVGDWGSFPPAMQKTPAAADVFVWCIILYSFPHCLPVKNRRVVVARNTLPARSTVVGNSGCEGLQG